MLQDSKLSYALCLGLIALLLAGCEARTLYRMQLPDLPEDGNWKTIRGEEFTLYLGAFNGQEAAGVYLVARSNVVSEPTWDWEEYQTWPNEEQTRVFATYYDQHYGTVEVQHESPCPSVVTHFEGRASAQETAYGRWLHSLDKAPPPGDHAKGVHIGFPIDECGDEELTVIVNGQYRFDVSMSIVVVETRYSLWFL